MEEAHILTVQDRGQGLGDAALGHPETRRLGAVDDDDELFGGVFHRIVHIDDIRRLLEDPAYLPGDGDLTGIVETKDLRHQG